MLVRELMEELRARGATVFLNSHLLGEVEATCDRVVFVKQGRAIHELEMANISDRLDVAIRTDRVDAAILQGLGTFGQDVRVEGDAIRLRVESEDVVPEIARWIVGQGIGLRALGSHRKTLEDWFIEVMGEDQRPG